MSRTFGRVLHRSSFLISACFVSLYSCNHTWYSRYRLDALEGSPESDLIVQTKAKAAKKAEILRAAQEFVEFANNGPSVYHVVDTIKSHLLRAEFVEIDEKNDWTGQLQAGGKYFVRRAGSSGNSIIAFAVGRKWQPGDPFAITAAHVDSPCLKIKPISDRTNSGFRQLGVETYGGGLWHSWFDRDLGLAGRAFVRTSPTCIESRLVLIDEPILRVPTVASHYEHQNPFKFDLETHLLPVISQQSQELSDGERQTAAVYEREPVSSEHNYVMTSASRRHPSSLVDKVAEKLETHPDNVIDFDLSLFDLQKATIGGANKEFIFSARIDNLMMTFCSLKGFLASLTASDALDDENCIRTYVAFDHEEIGSTGPMSAQSTFLPSIIERLAGSRKSESMARSLLISTDVIHGIHANYHGYHDVNHKPHLNAGIVFSSTSRRYLGKSTPSTITLLESICKLPIMTTDSPRAEIETEPPLTQSFVFPNARDCGSTVGPHLEANLGIRVVEMGNATLSMHSIREMAGSMDVDNAIRFMRLFFQNYSYFEQWVRAV